MSLEFMLAFKLKQFFCILIWESPKMDGNGVLLLPGIGSQSSMSLLFLHALYQLLLQIIFSRISVHAALDESSGISLGGKQQIGC